MTLKTMLTLPFLAFHRPTLLLEYNRLPDVNVVRKRVNTQAEEPQSAVRPPSREGVRLDGSDEE